MERTVNVRSVGVANVGTVLLRTTAVRVINHKNECSTLDYAQLGMASQTTLISDALKEELGLEVTPDPSIKIRTLGDQTAICLGRTNCTLESLNNDDIFRIEGSLCVSCFSDEESALPHAVDTSRLKDFNEIKIPVIPNRKRVGILIGQCDKSLMTVLSDREGAPSEPNLVFTRLGPIASSERV